MGKKLEDIAQELEAQFASAEFPIQVKTTGVGSMVIAVGQ
jgi:HAMP domain-containing protein